MAWNAYVDNMKAGGLQVCAIYGKEGGLWAKSDNWEPKQMEIVDVVRNLAAKNFPNGVFMGDEKYRVVSFTEDTVTAKRANAPSDNEKYLLHIACANTCLIIGGLAGANERSATKVVEDVRDYLAKAGY